MRLLPLFFCYFFESEKHDTSVSILYRNVPRRPNPLINWGRWHHFTLPLNNGNDKVGNKLLELVKFQEVGLANIFVYECLVVDLTFGLVNPVI